MISEQIPKRGRPPRQELYLRLDWQISELWNRMGGLPNPLEAAGIWEDIWYQEAHHSTAIEGNTLVQKQVEKLLAEGRAVGDKELREYMEVKGYADAAKWVYDQAIQPGAWSDGSPICLTELRHIHTQAMTALWDVAPHPDATPTETPGNFREHDIYPFPGGMVPPSWPFVPIEVDAWIKDVAKLEARTENFPEHLAALHSQFERVHPFIDGNGRTGRLVLNLILVRLGYPPAIIYKRQRNDYLRALRRADSGDAGWLGEIIARAILNNLYEFIVPKVAGPGRLVPLAALETEQISASALRLAASRSRLQATRGPDGQWRSCKDWVDEYLKQKYKRSS